MLQEYISIKSTFRIIFHNRVSFTSFILPVPLSAESSLVNSLSSKVLVVLKLVFSSFQSAYFEKTAHTKQM